MAVTGTSTFNLTRNEVIQAALRTLGVLGGGEAPSTEDYTNCSQALNVMVKSWAKQGLPLWVTTEVLVPLAAGVEVYPMGPTAGYVDTVTVTDGGTGYTSGTWDAVGGTTGTVASGTYIAEGGIVTFMTVLVGGTAYTSDPTSYTLSDIGSGATFTAQVVGVTGAKPLKVLDGTFVRNSAGTDSTLGQIARKDYNQFGSKTSAGVPSQFYYDTPRVNGQLFVFPVPSDSTATIYAQVQRQFFDMTAGSDDFDFPQEWFQALKWGLAAELAAEYGADLQMISYVEGKAGAFRMECFEFSVEEASVMFTVDRRG